MAASVATITTIAPRNPATFQLAVKESPSSLTTVKDCDDFFWTYTEEPHRTRRQAIIKAHPEVTKLCGPEPWTKYLVVLVVGLQLACAYLLRSTPFFSWTFFLTAYIVGATANQNLFLAIHEISHNLAFRSPKANRLLAIFANLPIGIPYSASFRVSLTLLLGSIFYQPSAQLLTLSLARQPYHLTHHKSLGVDGLDTDLPTSLEAIFLDSILGKAFFCTFQILFYAVRPMFVYNLPLTPLHFLNIAVQVAFDTFLVKSAGGKALAYLIFSSFLAGSLHPCAGHFIAEHYILGTASSPSAPKNFSTTVSATTTGASTVPKPDETYSYYGPLNLLTYNVGLHNEHHDFPAVPWTRLPALRNLAHEFYDDLPCHRSWVGVMWQFVLDDDVGLWCRLKRKDGGRKVGGAEDYGE